MATIQLRDGGRERNWRSLPQASAVLEVGRNVAERTHASAIQIDFDAPQSEWVWYRELLGAWA